MQLGDRVYLPIKYCFRIVFHRQELEQKETELKSKGIITSVAAQQQIAAGNAEASITVSRMAHLEGELAEAKVGAIM